MPLDSYDGLKSSIEEHLDRDDLTGFIDDFIDLAEARHRREVRIREMIRRARADASDRFIALPPGFLQMKTLRYSAARRGELLQVPLDIMERERRDTAGEPRFYAIHEEIEFDRTPAASIEMIYYAKLPPLSASVASNALLARAPDLYLYAALAASAPFLTDDERIATWNGAYKAGVAELAAEDRQARFSGPLVSRVAGRTP